MTIPAAVLAAVLFVGMAAFQAGLALGAPFGAHVLGGRHPGTLPNRLRSDEEAITTGTRDAQIREMFDGVSEQVVVFGHTHAQFERRVDRWRLVNPGSVGNPFGPPGAYWAILGSEVELRSTPYDVATTAAQIRTTGLPNAEMIAMQLENPGPASLAADLFS